MPETIDLDELRQALLETLLHVGTQAVAGDDPDGDDEERQEMLDRLVSMAGDDNLQKLAQQLSEKPAVTLSALEYIDPDGDPVDSAESTADRLMEAVTGPVRRLSREAREDLLDRLRGASPYQGLSLTRAWLEEWQTRLADTLSEAHLLAALDGMRELSGTLDTSEGIPAMVQQALLRALQGPGYEEADYRQPDAAPTGIPPSEILQRADELRSRRLLDRAQFDRISKAVRGAATDVAAEEGDRVLGVVRQAILDSASGGGTLQDFTRQVEAAVGAGTFLSPAHAEMVFRTGVMQAYSEGQDHLLDDPAVGDLFPYARYIATHDDRTRPEHLAMETRGIDGTAVYSRSDPVFQVFRPPWSFSCRCTWTPLTVSEAAAEGVEEARNWIRTGMPPARPARVVPPPWRPEPDFQRIELATTGAEDDSPEDSEDFARLYVELLNAFADAGADVPDELLDAASEDLEASGWDLEEDEEGVWHAKREGIELAAGEGNPWVEAPSERFPNRWYNPITKRYRYQQSRPGTGRQKREKTQAAPPEKSEAEKAKRPSQEYRQNAIGVVADAEARVRDLYDRLAEKTMGVRASGKHPGDIGTRYRGRIEGLRGRGDPHPTPTVGQVDQHVTDALRDLDNRAKELVRIATQDGKRPLPPEILADYPDLAPATERPQADREALRQRLQPHARELAPHQRQAVGAAWRMFQRHHGAGALDRVAQLAEWTQAALDGVAEGDKGDRAREGLRLQLAKFNAMLGLAEPAKEEPKEKEEKAPAPGLPKVLPDWARSVQSLADSLDTGWGENKVLVSDAYEAAKRADPSLTPEGFKDRLKEAHRAGLIDLSRADLVQAMHPDDVEASRVNLAPGRSGGEPVGMSDPEANLITVAPRERKPIRSPGEPKPSAPDLAPPEAPAAPEAPVETPAPEATKEPAPEPGFTGTDANGHRWVNGDQVAKGEDDSRHNEGSEPTPEAPPVIATTPEVTRPKISESEIPYDVALRAHQGTSFVPEDRAKMHQREYASTLNEDYDTLAKFSRSPEELALLGSEFERYREGFRERYLAYLHARGGMISSMIAGPANFPVARAEKKADTAHRRLNELLEFRNRALQAIRKKLRPEAGPIKSSDPEAVSRLQTKLQQLQAGQERMRQVNAAHKKFLKDPASLDKSGLSDADKERVRTYKPEYSWEPHPFPPYAMTNNSAEIRRLQERIQQVGAMQSSPRKEEEWGDVTVVENPEAARIQLTFPGKPDESTRSLLKSAGFRWSPSEGAWQRHLNNAGRAAVENVMRRLGKQKTRESVETPGTGEDWQPPPAPITTDIPRDESE